MPENSWGLLTDKLNALHRELQQKPKSLRVGHWENVGSILNAYREGDLSFDEAAGKLQLREPVAQPEVECHNDCDWRGDEADLVDDEHGGDAHCPKCGSNSAILDAIPQQSLSGASQGEWIAVGTLLYACICELEDIQQCPDHSLCATSAGKRLIEEGMKFLGVKDLSAETWPPPPEKEP